MTQPKISSIAYLIAEPARAVILITLAHGSSLSASALANAAGVTPQTASSHLAKLLDGGLLTVEIKGRNRFYALAGPDVAHALESLAAVSPQTSSWRSLPNRAAHELHFARCCYDHLAGQVGVAITQAMLERGLMLELNEREYGLTLRGIEWLQALDPQSGEPCLQDKVQTRRCLDWTERQHHIAGPLGNYLLDTFCQRGWLRRVANTRAVHVTDSGWLAFKEHFGIEHLRHLEASLHPVEDVRKTLNPMRVAG